MSTTIYFTIENIIKNDDFYSKNNDINKSFYVLKGEITQIEKGIYSWKMKQLCDELGRENHEKAR